MGCRIWPMLKDLGRRRQSYLVGWHSCLSLQERISKFRLSSHVKFSPNSRFVLASTQDSTIRLWNYQTSRCVKTYTGHVNRTYCIPACFITLKGPYLVSGSEDCKVYIWDLQTRQVLQVLEGHRGNCFYCYYFCEKLITFTWRYCVSGGSKSVSLIWAYWLNSLCSDTSS